MKLKLHEGNHYSNPWTEDISNQNPDGSLKYFYKGTAHGGGCYISDECGLDDYGRMLEV